MKNLTRLAVIIFASILIVSSSGLVAAAVTTQQKDTNQEKDYPVIIHPTGVLPSSIPKTKFQSEVFRYGREGSVYIVSLNLKPLRTESDRTKRVEFWLGEESGYIILDRIKIIKNGRYTTWIGKSKDRKTTGVLTFGESIAYGTIESDTRLIGILPVKDSDFHVIYEADPSKRPVFCDDAVIHDKK